MNDQSIQNTIMQRQVTENNLDRLAAQRQLYSEAKRVLAIQMSLTVPAIVIGSFLVFWNKELEAGVAFYSVIVGILEGVLFEPWQKRLKEGAARVQEAFDCDVFALPWSLVKAGHPPDPEQVLGAAARYKRTESDFSSLKNWYPAATGVLPMRLARSVCQRANCWWDGYLRRRYATWSLSVAGIVTIIVFTLALIRDLTIQSFFLRVVAPLFPVLILGLRQYQEQKEAAENADRLKEYADAAWDQSLNGTITPDELDKIARDLQDEIFAHRRQSPLIFDAIYKRLRNVDEEVMNKGAETLVEEATRRQKNTS